MLLLRLIFTPFLTLSCLSRIIIHPFKQEAFEHIIGTVKNIKTNNNDFCLHGLNMRVRDGVESD